MRSRQNFYWINGSKSSESFVIYNFDYEKMENTTPHLNFNLRCILYFDGSINISNLLSRKEGTHVKEDKATNDFFPSTSGFSNNMKS